MIRLEFVRTILLPVLVACAFAYGYRFFWSGSSTSTPNQDLHEIPISRVLNQALRLTDVSSPYVATPFEISLLSHALLVLQNPELTPFAGAGYGFELRHPNPGAVIEPFPGGKLPKANGRGRYDDWARVKGLRWAAALLNTDPWRGGLLRAPEGQGGKLEDRHWREIVDGIGIGGAALLLEVAGAEDWEYPMPPGSGRNAYGEAVDRLVDRLFDENITPRILVDAVSDRAETESFNNFTVGNDIGASNGKGEAPLRDVSELLPDSASAEQQTRREARNRRQRWIFGEYCPDSSNEREGRDSLMLCNIRAEDVYTIPSLLADYAVARQNLTWLVKAFALFRAYHDHAIWLRYADTESNDTPVLSFDTIEADRAQPKMSRDTQNRTLDPSRSLQATAYAHLSAVRLWYVMQMWQPPHVAVLQAFNSSESFVEWREDSKRSLAKVSKINWDVQLSVSSMCRGETSWDQDPLENKSSKRNCSDDIAYLSMLVSTSYRLAILLEQQPENGTDACYASIADHVHATGLISSDGVPALKSLVAIVIMYAARRDCVKVGSCVQAARSYSSAI